MGGGHHEADAGLLDAALDRRRLDADLHAERAERIGATIIAKPFRLEVLRRSVLTTIAAHVKEARAKEGGGALP